MSIVDWVDRLPVGGKTAAGVLGATIALGVGAYGTLSNPGPSDCDAAPLRHVYRPQRLHVVAKCQRITVTVKGWRREHDGDYHVNVAVDGGGWVNAANIRGQKGNTVIEWVPGDPKPNRFYVGQRLQILTTKVYDQQHKRRTEQWGWIEGHPVFEVKEMPSSTPVEGGQVPAPTEDDGR